MRRVGSRLVVVALAAACALSSSCGGEEAAPVVIAAIPLIAPGQNDVRPPPSGPRQPVRGTIAFVTIGSFPPALATAIEEGLRNTLQVDIRRYPPQQLPQAAYYPTRRRYRADRLLQFLGDLTRNEPPSVRVLGMTEVDISITKGRIQDWGIFGLGDLGGRSSVISSFRLRPGARDDAHFRRRIVTTAVHEVGHTLGLDHCVEPTCLMRDAEGSIETVDSSTGLGAECRAQLDRESPAILIPDTPAPARTTP